MAVGLDLGWHDRPAGRPVSFDIVAPEAGVSRSWLYGQADLRAEIIRLRGATTAPSAPLPARQRASDASLRRRLEVANQRVRELTRDNQRLREQLVVALGESPCRQTPRAGQGDPDWSLQLTPPIRGLGVSPGPPSTPEPAGRALPRPARRGGPLASPGLLRPTSTWRSDGARALGNGSAGDLRRHGRGPAQHPAPDAERLDGHGGDGGRDLQLRHDGRLDLFELKSFTGRLGRAGGRRAQVERSLKKAATHQPDSWTLVVPIDHTQGELAWFDKLRSRYRFPLIWRGRTWLDGQMTTHPAIVRYYLEGGDSRVVRVLLELQREQADLTGGLPEALSRLEVLRQCIDESSPHYRLDISMVGDAIAVQLHPRYRGAERDHPIMITGAFAFPDTPSGREAAQRLERALDFGDQVVIEPEHVRELHMKLPGQLGEGDHQPQIIMGPAVEDPPFRLDGRAVITDPAGTLLGSLPLRFTRRRTGRRGGVLTGQDIIGILRLEVLVDTTTHHGKMDFQIASRLRSSYPGRCCPPCGSCDTSTPPTAWTCGSVASPR